MEGLAPWFFRWLEQRLLALWWLAFEAIYRMQLMDAWSGYLIVLAVAGCVDGLVRRQIRRIDHGYASGDQHLIARRSITVLAIAPLIYLCVPVTVVPMVIPAWGGLLVLALAQLTANLQHRI
jgi:hypothetical protein